MKNRGDGTIINITGLAADRTDAGYVAGTAGNASLNAFTRAVGGRSLNDGVRILSVSPGPVATDRIVKLMQDKARNEARKKIESSITSNKALIEKSDKDFSKSIAKKINETTDNINLEKTKKITELLQNSSSIAEKIINKVIDINVDKKELNIFIKKSSVLITKEHKNGN